MVKFKKAIAKVFHFISDLLYAVEARAQLINLILTIIAVVYAIFLFNATQEQVRISDDSLKDNRKNGARSDSSTREALEMTRQQLNMLMNESAATIVFNPIGAMEYNFSTKEGVYGSIKWTNIGRTKAVNFRYHVNDTLLPKRKNFIMPLNSIIRDSIGVTIMPGVSSGNSFKFTNGPTNDSLLRWIMTTGDIVPYFWGIMEYEDIYERTHKCTFCYKYDVGLGYIQYGKYNNCD